MKILKIIVISLVIIVTVIFMIFTRVRQSAKKQEIEIAIHQIQYIKSAIAAYIFNTGRLPGTLEDLIVCPEGLESSWKGPYLKESQFYDPWKNMYLLEYGYRLQSLGADGIKGGTGKNADVEKFTGLIKNENEGDS